MSINFSEVSITNKIENQGVCYLLVTKIFCTINKGCLISPESKM